MTTGRINQVATPRPTTPNASRPLSPPTGRGGANLRIGGMPSIPSSGRDWNNEAAATDSQRAPSNFIHGPTLLECIEAPTRAIPPRAQRTIRHARSFRVANRGRQDPHAAAEVQPTNALVHSPPPSIIHGQATRCARQRTTTIRQPDRLRSVARPREESVNLSGTRQLTRRQINEGPPRARATRSTRSLERQLNADHYTPANPRQPMHGPRRYVWHPRSNDVHAGQPPN